MKKKRKNFGFLPFPIVRQMADPLENSHKSRLRELANNFKKQISLEAESKPLVVSGVSHGPNFFIHDKAGVALCDPSFNFLQYRMLPLARKDDIVALSTKKSVFFEEYCEKNLGLKKPEVFHLTSQSQKKSLAEICLADQKILHRLIGHAKKNKNLNIHPYMGNSQIWELAKYIAKEAKEKIHVAASCPELTKLVNNKIWFNNICQIVLGKDSTVNSKVANNKYELLKHFLDLANKHKKVVVKVPNSSSGLGNYIIDIESKFLKKEIGLAELFYCLESLGWKENYPLLLSEWKTNTIKSPSVQFWIPSPFEGEPVLEGIFDQVINPTRGSFLGATPTTFKKNMENKIATEGYKLAFFLQSLGYFGRCSMDALLVGQNIDNAQLNWVECNGRWGGVSFPMTLVNSLFGNWKKNPFLIMKAGKAAIDSVKDELAKKLKPGMPGAVMFMPNLFERGLGADLIVFASSINEAWEFSKNFYPEYE